MSRNKRRAHTSARGDGKSGISNRPWENYSAILKGLENVVTEPAVCVAGHRISWLPVTVCVGDVLSAPPAALIRPVRAPSPPEVFRRLLFFPAWPRQRSLLPRASVVPASSNVSGLTGSRTHCSSFSRSRVSAELSSNSGFQMSPFFPIGLLHGSTFASLHGDWDDLSLGL